MGKETVAPRADLAAILEKRESEVKEIEARLAAVQKDLNVLKPSVDDYNAKAKWRKDLRRELAHKQRDMRVVAQFFNGMNLFDERFPLFAAAKQNGNHQSQPPTTNEA